MQTNATATHPAPQRRRTGWLRLLIGIAGAPAAWVALMMIGNMVSSYSCYPHGMPLAHPLWSGIGFWLTMLSLICIAFSLICGTIAFTDWRRTRHEVTGGKAHAINTGSGRTRFLALIGLMSSGLFIAAIFFTSCAIWMIAPCRPWLLP